MLNSLLTHLTGMEDATVPSVRENNVANSRRSSGLTSSYQASSHKSSGSSQQQRMTGEHQGVHFITILIY